MIKVLIIAGALHIGGAERVAANLCQYAPAKEFAFDYVVFDGYENVYGHKIEARGGRVITLAPPRKGYLHYCIELSRLIRRNRYSVVHSHTQFNSGINLAIAKLLGVPIRIAHSHTTKTEHPVSMIQKLYEHAMRCLIRHSATELVACGVEAGHWMFGRKRFNKKGIVLRNGIDARMYSFSEENRSRIRALYGISPNSFVIGHTGTLQPLKNQEFLIRLLPDLLANKPDTVLLLLGGGSSAEQVRLEIIAAECGVRDSIIFGGPVLNVHEALSAMDVFAFPSLREGTPLSLLEAQANGLPCIVSDLIPNDAFLTDLISVLPLDNTADWVTALCSAKRLEPKYYAERIMESGYDVHQAYLPVYTLYRSIASVSLSFDDGRGDNTEILDKLLLPMGIPATLNITTGYVDGSCPRESLGTWKTPMTIKDIRRLSADPRIEIAMHGDFHQNSEKDILNGRKKLLAWLGLPQDALLGFASPGSGLSPARFRSVKSAKLRSSMIYCRSSLRLNSLVPLRIICRKAGHILHMPILYEVAYHDTVMTEADGQLVYSVPVMRDATVKEVMAIVRSAVRRRGALVLMLHSICESTEHEDNWSWRRDKLVRLCESLSELELQGKLHLCPTVVQYEQLRERVISVNQLERDFK